MSIEEPLFLHDEKSNQIWLVGAINTETKEVVHDSMKVGDSINLRLFAYNHINHIEPWLTY